MILSNSFISCCKMRRLSIELKKCMANWMNDSHLSTDSYNYITVHLTINWFNLNIMVEKTRIEFQFTNFMLLWGVNGMPFKLFDSSQFKKSLYDLIIWNELNPILTRKQIMYFVYPFFHLLFFIMQQIKEFSI